MKKLFLLCACFLISSCGGAGGPSERDVELMIERLAVTNSVEDAAEDGIMLAMTDAYPVFAAYIENYDSWYEPIQIGRSGFVNEWRGGTLDYSAEFTYEKIGEGAYHINLNIKSILYNTYGVPAVVTTDTYANNVTNTTPMTASVIGDVDLANDVKSLYITGEGENFTVGGEIPGSVSRFVIIGTSTGSILGASPYTCTSDSKMTLTLSNGETVTCTLSEDCQKCD